jgi:hypothetical protein
VKE